jgi:hypothetical protein
LEDALNKAFRLTRTSSPFTVIGSPACTAPSVLLVFAKALMNNLGFTLLKILKF